VCTSPAQKQLSAQYLSAEYEPAKTLIADTSSTPGSTVFTVKVAHPDHCSQMEIVVVGMTRQSPNVVIMGPSDVGTIFTIKDDPDDPTAECQFTVAETFVWQQLNVRRSPTATPSYVVTRKVKPSGAPSAAKLSPEGLAYSLRPPGSFNFASRPARNMMGRKSICRLGTPTPIVVPSGIETFHTLLAR
jgi:hypothetical protein